MSYIERLPHVLVFYTQIFILVNTDQITGYWFMLLLGSFLLHCPLTSKFWIHSSAEHFKQYTTGFLYVYSSMPLHMELQILEFNKGIMKLQEILK